MRSPSEPLVDVVFGLCQTSPVHCDPAASIEAVDALLSGVERGSLDILVLCELALAGYRFDTAEAIEPFLESPSGRTFEWARATARRLDCVVCVGFAERGDEGRRYNSQLTVSSRGAPARNVDLIARRPRPLLPQNTPLRGRPALGDGGHRLHALRPRATCALESAAMHGLGRERRLYGPVRSSSPRPD